MRHQIPNSHSEAINGLFQSIGSIEIYQKGFNDGVQSVIGSLRQALTRKAAEAAEAMGIDQSQFLLDPINGTFEPRVVAHNKQATQNNVGQVADKPGHPIQITPQQAAEIENIRRAKEARLRRQKELELELAKVKKERELSKDKLEELSGHATAFSPPMAKPLHSPEIPLESNLAQRSTATRIDKQVDAVLASIKERNS